jgi:hydroxyquinol 1,2-dioxygenase
MRRGREAQVREFTYEERDVERVRSLVAPLGDRIAAQYEGEWSDGRGWLRSGTDGEHAFWSVRPSPYPIADDGPVGEQLAATGRSPMRPAHLHFTVDAPGHRTPITHVCAAGDPYLGDAVFGVKESLVVEFAEHPAGAAPDGWVLDTAWAGLNFDIVLEARP